MGRDVNRFVKILRTAAREDIMEKLVEICFEIVIISFICVSLFSGRRLDTTQAAANPAP